MQHIVTPETARKQLGFVQPGDEVIFKRGQYRQTLRLALGNHGKNSPVTLLRAEDGVVFTQNKEGEDFRRQANIWADERQRSGKFPGLGLHIRKSFLTFDRCENVSLQGVWFEKSWPTHIFLENSAAVEIRDCHFTDGTFAIAAEGEKCYGFHIHHCSWRQDPIPGRLWQKIPWWRIHGAVGDGFPPVDIENDWRHMDGDFFRGFNIPGGVFIHHCSIGQAFNAIHLYNKKMNENRSLDVNIHGCQFFEIRDNVIEAEKGARNWWFWHNQICNVHKPLSLEIRKGGNMYFFGNRFWFNSLQGPPGKDANRGGGLFKFDKKTRNKKTIPSYFFNNSIFTRADYMRKGQLHGLRHFNNAVQFVMPDQSDYEDGFIEDLPEIFGNLTAGPHDWAFRFASQWKPGALDIQFENDLMQHAGWPGIIKINGYPLKNPRASADPGFKNKFAGDFLLKPGSPCLNTAIGKDLILPDNSRWRLKGGQNLGAYQGENLIEGPDFQSVAKGYPLPPGIG